MKKMILSIGLCLLLGTCWVQAKTVNLHLTHVAGMDDFVLDTGVYENADNLTFKITRLEYYISEIQLVYDGGQTIDLEDVFLLVNTDQEVYELGDFEVENIEAINFHIGVPEAENHADPSAWDADHPLAPQNPSMHWGWTAGYRFIALEGFSDPNQDQSFNSIFQFHAVSDDYYTDVSFSYVTNSETENIDIAFEVDVLKMLTGVNIVDNLVHGTGMDNRRILTNMESNDVFKAVSEDPDVPQSLGDTQQESNFTFSPNPASSVIQVPFYFPNQSSMQFCLIDITGRMVFEQSLGQSSGSLTIAEDLNNGIYFGVFYNEKGMLARKKLVIMQ